MGQRHQIYLRLPKVDYGGTNPNNRGEVTVGMHNQWLFGMNAISCLHNFFKFVDANKGNTCHPFEKPSPQDGESILNAAYSIDFETGFHTGNSVFETDPKHKDYCGETTDPRRGDNNNGITVIDLADLKNPAYCFMSIGHLECLDKSKYDREESDDPAYANFAPISAEEWIALHYGDNWATRKDTPVMNERIEFVQKNFKVLTTKRLIEIFPKMKASLLQGEIDKRNLRPNSLRIIESLNAVSSAVKKDKKQKLASARS